jgi:hypothetical protein
MARPKRTTKATPKAKETGTTSFQMLWTDELEVVLIEIMRRYIEGGRLADNMFKAQDYTAIAIEIQSSYISLNVGPACNRVSGVQIKGHIEWVSTCSSAVDILLILFLVQEEIQVMGYVKGHDWFWMESGTEFDMGRGGALGRPFERSEE